MASQAYFEGDWWQATATTSAGQSPATTPSKWVRLAIPAEFERYLVQAAYARLLPGEGLNDKRRQEQALADMILAELRQRYVNQSGTGTDHRPNVLTR
jgi:hypothetical protein